MTEMDEDGCQAGNTTPPETVEPPEPMSDEEFAPFGYDPDRDPGELDPDDLGIGGS